MFYSTLSVVIILLFFIRVFSPTLNSRPALKRPQILKCSKSLWIVSEKKALKSLGYSLSQWNVRWIRCWWQLLLFSAMYCALRALNYWRKSLELRWRVDVGTRLYYAPFSSFITCASVSVYHLVNCCHWCHFFACCFLTPLWFIWPFCLADLSHWTASCGADWNSLVDLEALELLMHNVVICHICSISPSFSDHFFGLVLVLNNVIIQQCRWPS